jgi:hypothetical protein
VSISLGGRIVPTGLTTYTIRTSRKTLREELVRSGFTVKEEHPSTGDFTNEETMTLKSGKNRQTAWIIVLLAVLSS